MPACIAFEIPAATRATLEIYDVRGVRVHLLHDGAIDAGRRSAIWDGRNTAGQDVVPGLYFVRLTTELDGVVSRRVSKVR